MTLVRRLIFPVLAAGRSSATYSLSGPAYDVAIGGLPFLLATDSDHPFQRMTADYRKEQVDQAAEPGEQSLAFWWLRSQLSFHGGAGRLIGDPLGQESNAIRYSTSTGVNPWEPGAVTMLKKATVLESGAADCLLTAMDGTAPVIFQSNATALRRVTESSTAAVTWGGAQTIQSIVSDGSSYFAADKVGVYKGTHAGGNGALVWNTGANTVVLGWVKQRLMAGVGPSVYELVGAGPALPTAAYTHPNPSWVWTAFAEGPKAIYAAGYAGAESAVFRFTLDDSTGLVPTLTAADVVCQIPTGERVTALGSYLGSRLGIGTTKGIRIGVIQANAEVDLGPLTVELPASAPAVKGIVGFGRFLYCGFPNGIDGLSGLVRIDLSSEIEKGRFSYATDLTSAATGQVTGVGLFSDRLVFTVAATGCLIEHATDLVTTGTLTTGRIRFNTLEPKLFAFLTVRGKNPLAGSLTASVIDAQDSSRALVTYTDSIATLEETKIPLAPQEYVQVKFTFTRGSSHTVGPELRGYQVKALPAGKRPRVEILPLSLYDRERNRHGQASGSLGSAHARLRALEALEQAGVPVLLQHFDAEGQTSSMVVIDKIQMIGTAAPSDRNGWGGVVQVLLRVIS